MILWIQHSCLANKVFALDPSTSGINRLYLHSGSADRAPSLCDQGVAGSIPGRVIPKTLTRPVARQDSLPELVLVNQIKKK